jgi:hypothetical protein
MTAIGDIIAEFRSSPRVRVLPPSGAVTLPAGLTLPPDLSEFYTLCGGVQFLDPTADNYPDYRILPPDKVVNIGTATCLEPSAELPLSAWYTVGEDDNGDHVVVDLHTTSGGRCYDVFHETFAMPEYANVVADSFLELLQRVYRRGKAYWFDDGFRHEPFRTPGADG